MLMLFSVPIFAIPCGVFASAYQGYMEQMYFPELAEEEMEEEEKEEKGLAGED